MNRQNRCPLRSILAFALASTLVAGCGGTNEKGLVPVSGKVTLDGGAWPKPGKINFLPKDSPGSNEMRPASADFDTSGNFTVSSYEGVRGMYPGEYWASVECWEVEPGMGMGAGAADAAKVDPKKKTLIAPAGKSVVPKKYQSSETSGFAVKVEPGTAVNANFDVKTK